MFKGLNNSPSIGEPLGSFLCSPETASVPSLQSDESVLKFVVRTPKSLTTHWVFHAGYLPSCLAIFDLFAPVIGYRMKTADYETLSYAVFARLLLFLFS